MGRSIRCATRRHHQRAGARRSRGGRAPARQGGKTARAATRKRSSSWCCWTRGGGVERRRARAKRAEGEDAVKVLRRLGLPRRSDSVRRERQRGRSRGRRRQMDRQTPLAVQGHHEDGDRPFSARFEAEPLSCQARSAGIPRQRRRGRAGARRLIHAATGCRLQTYGETTVPRWMNPRRTPATIARGRVHVDSSADSFRRPSACRRCESRAAGSRHESAVEPRLGHAGAGEYSGAPR